MSGTRSKGKGKGKGKKSSGKVDDMPDIWGKKKRRYNSDSEDDDDTTKRGSPSVSKLMNRGIIGSGADTPAELFRKDLISAMKLPDTEPLLQEEYTLILDSWRQEWEKGVQVPVNSDFIPEANVNNIRDNDTKGDFKLPRKMLHASQDDTYKPGYHELTGMQQLADQVCRYDLEDTDVQWLFLVNMEREEIGELPIHEWIMEKVMEEIEIKCHDNMEDTIKNSEGTGIEYDEDVVCDVCRSPDSEENNEMVFCDNCDICVHQACYGITTIPQGNWLCRICNLRIKPSCILCPKSGGAMKSTKSGTKWAHVSCALWIPEVSIGDVEKMEPITKISNIPTSRWALVCTLCRERVGACIQCSVKTCKTAFHVTCAFQHQLEMKTILDETDVDDGVKLKAYCPKHTKGLKEGCRSPRKDSAPASPSKNDLTEAERENLRLQKIEELREEFYSFVTVDEVVESLAKLQVDGTLQIDKDTVDTIYEYWKLKRKSMFNKPLMTPKRDEEHLLNKQQEDSLVARMKMFVHLRQDLERVRNLCYMVSRREKIRRSYYKLREQIFKQQLEVMELPKITKEDVQAVKEASMKGCIYDNPDFILEADEHRDYIARQLDISGERKNPIVLPLKEGEVLAVSAKENDKTVLMESTETVRQTRQQSPKNKSPKRDSDIVNDRVHMLRSPKPESDTEACSDKLTSVKSPKRETDPEHANGRLRSLRSPKHEGDGELVHERTRTLRSPKHDGNASKISKTPEKHVPVENVKLENIRTLRSDKTEQVKSVKGSRVRLKSEAKTEVDDENVAIPVKRELRKRNNSNLATEDDKKLNQESYLAEKKPDKLFDDKIISRDLNGVSKLEKFVINSKLREEVQSKAFSSRRLKPFLNGINDKTQRKLESYFTRLPKQTFNSKNKIDSDRSVRELRVTLCRSPTTIPPNGHNSPRALRGYNSPKKENRRYKSENIPYDQTGECNSPETRSTRKRISTDLNSNATDRRLFENVDNEISICRSSRDASPVQDLSYYTNHESETSFNFEETMFDVIKRRKRKITGESDESFVDIENCDSESSHSGSEHSGPGRRTRTRSRVVNTDESSCDSASNRYPKRTRIAEGLKYGVHGLDPSCI